MKMSLIPLRAFRSRILRILAPSLLLLEVGGGSLAAATLLPGVRAGGEGRRSGEEAVVAAMRGRTPGIPDSLRQRGEVREAGEEGAPIPEAWVELLDPDGVSVARTTTDDGGRFEIVAPRAGCYRIRASRRGFLPEEGAPFALPIGDHGAPGIILRLRSRPSPGAGRGDPEPSLVGGDR